MPATPQHRALYALGRQHAQTGQSAHPVRIGNEHYRAGFLSVEGGGMTPALSHAAALAKLDPRGILAQRRRFEQLDAAREHSVRVATEPLRWCQYCEGPLTHGWCADCEEPALPMECAA